jgi:hypothetical protein
MVFFIGLGESKVKYACYYLTLSLVIASSIYRFQGKSVENPSFKSKIAISWRRKNSRAHDDEWVVGAGIAVPTSL